MNSQNAFVRDSGRDIGSAGGSRWPYAARGLSRMLVGQIAPEQGIQSILQYCFTCLAALPTSLVKTI